jgi:uncharacterized RDD family membrane protein YckC
LITPPAPGPPVPPAPFVSPVQPPFLESAQITAALRLGWYFTELRGRHDEAVFRNPRPPVVEDEDSLCLGDERTRDEQAAEVAAVVAAAAGTLNADPDVATFAAVDSPPSGTTASKSLLEISERLRKSAAGPARDKAWHDLEDLLVDWDQAIQRSLAVASPRVAAGYRLGRALSDVRWSLHPARFDDDPNGWQFLIGPWRSAMIARLIDRLTPYFTDKLTPIALKRSVAGWAAVVLTDDLVRAPGTARRLVQQSQVWHDLLLGERSGSDIIDHNVESLVRKPSVLLLAMRPFRLEIAVVTLSVLGFIAAGWLLFTNTPPAPSGMPMGSAPAAQSVVGVAQNVGGRSAVSAVIAILSLFGVTLAGLSAGAKARLQNLVQGIRDSIDTVLVADAGTMLPATTWPLPAEGNLYLRFATLRQRSLAVLVDWLVLLALDVIVILATWLVLSFFAFGQLALRNTVVVVTLLMSFLYFAGQPAKSGRGIGMWTQRMRILDAAGGWLPGTDQTIKRAVAILVPFELLAVAFWLWPVGWGAVAIIAAIAWVAYLCWSVAAHSNKRGWHDVWAGTVVVAATDPAYDFATVARERPVAPPMAPHETAPATVSLTPVAAPPAAASDPPEAERTPADPTAAGTARPR